MDCHMTSHNRHQHHKVKTLQGTENKKGYQGLEKSELGELCDSYHSCSWRDGRLSNRSKKDGIGISLGWGS